MKFIMRVKFSLIAIMCFMTVQSQSIVQGGMVDNLSIAMPRTFAEEKEKWMYVSSMLGENVQVSKTMVQEIGAFMKNHVGLISYLLGAIGGLVLHELLLNSDSVWYKKMCDKMGVMSLGFPRSINEVSADSLIARAFTVMAFPAIATATLLLYFFNTYVGDWIESKPEQCRKALVKFVVDCQGNMARVPLSLAPFFEALSRDIAQNGCLTIISDAQAQQIVEGLVACGAIAVIA